MRGAMEATVWVADNLLNFTPHGAVLGGVLALLLLWLGHRTSGSVAGVLALACLGWALVIHSSLETPSDAGLRAGEQPLRVMIFNVEGGRTGGAAKAAEIAAVDPDVLLVQEVAPVAEAELLVRLERLFPYRASLSGPDAPIFSKFPFTRAAQPVLSDEPSKRGWQIGVRLPDGQELTLVNVQVTRPHSIANWSRRTVEYHELAAFARTHAAPLIMAGDFNASGLSPVFFSFVQNGDLRAARPGLFPPRTTWPAGLPGLGIQIDHVLVRGALRRLASHSPAPAGSNHRPMVVDLAIGGG